MFSVVSVPVCSRGLGKGVLFDHCRRCIGPNHIGTIFGQVQTYSTWTSLYRDPSPRFVQLEPHCTGTHRTVAKRVVRTLLECFLVTSCFWTEYLSFNSAQSPFLAISVHAEDTTLFQSPVAGPTSDVSAIYPLRRHI